MNDSEITIADYMNKAPCFLRTKGIASQDGYFYLSGDDIFSIDECGIFNLTFDSAKYHRCMEVVEITEQEFVDRLKVFFNKTPKDLINKALSVSGESSAHKLLTLVDIANKSKDEVTKALIPYIESVIESSLF